MTEWWIQRAATLTNTCLTLDWKDLSGTYQRYCSWFQNFIEWITRKNDRNLHRLGHRLKFVFCRNNNYSFSFYVLSAMLHVAYGNDYLLFLFFKGKHLMILYWISDQCITHFRSIFFLHTNHSNGKSIGNVNRFTDFYMSATLRLFING